MDNEAKIANNTAVNTLMNDGLMIGRHRPVVAKWYQEWVDEVSSTLVLPDAEGTAENRQAALDSLREDMAKKLLECVEVGERKVCLAPGWRPGKQIPKDAPMGTEYVAKINVFRNVAKGNDHGAAVSPNDSKTVLGR